LTISGIVVDSSYGIGKDGRRISELRRVQLVGIEERLIGTETGSDALDCMKKRNNLKPLILLFLPCFFNLFLSSLVSASVIDETLVFKKIAVLDLEDRTAKAFGVKIGKIIRAELEQMLRFDITPPEKVLIRYPLSAQTLRKSGKELQLDGFIVGWVTHSNQLATISLEILDRNGEVFALELLAVKERTSQADLEKNVQKLIVKLIHRIPYKAIVTQVHDRLVTFDAGRVQGVEIGSRASIFEIVGLKRNPFTNEVISFDREDSGEILVTQVEALSATGKIISLKKGAKIFVHQKVDFIPSQKVIQESLGEKKELLAEQQRELESRKAERRPSTKETLERPRGSVMIGTGFVLNDYRFSSDQLSFTRRTSPVPMVTVMGEYWLFAPIGLDASYATSWILFDQINGTPIDIGASPYWVSAHLKYRYFFSDSTTSPEIVGSVGYRIYDFPVDKSDLVFFNNVRYRGVDITLAASYPITSRFKGVLNLAVQPALLVRENPVTSGTSSSAYGYSVGLTGYFKIFDGLMLGLGYHYEAYEAKFGGTGTRNQPAFTTNAKSHDVYQGARLSVIYEF
jgi:hypothetical protein